MTKAEREQVRAALNTPIAVTKRERTKATDREREIRHSEAEGNYERYLVNQALRAADPCHDLQRQNELIDSKDK